MIRTTYNDMRWCVHGILQHWMNHVTLSRILCNFCDKFINYMITGNLNIEMTVPFDIIKDAVGNDVMILKSHSYTYDVKDGAEFFFDNLYFGNKTASKLGSFVILILKYFFQLHKK